MFSVGVWTSRSSELIFRDLTLRSLLVADIRRLFQ
jgi:hypothetical protein